MTDLDKMRWLQEYRSRDKRVSRKREEYERVRALCEKTVSTITGMPRGGGDVREALYARLVDMERELAVEAGDIASLREEIEGAIDAVQDEGLKTLLICRYLRGWPWRDVAGQMGQRECTVRGRLHKKALDALYIV